MSWKIEREPNGDEAIVIDGWTNGIGADPYSGLGYLLGVDLETPGEVAVGYPLTANATSGGTLTAPIADSTRFFPTYMNPTSIATGAAQSYAILDDSGQVWEATSISGTWTKLSSGASTSGAGDTDGIAYWLGYLFKTRGANIDYWDGSTWHNAFETTLQSGVQHTMYVATNNQLYITNGSKIARLYAPDPSIFVPITTVTATGSFSSSDTTGTLTAVWPYQTATIPGTFSNGDERDIVFSNGSAGISWTGGLTGSATSTITIDAFNFSTNIVEIPLTDVALSLAEVGGGNSSQSTLLIGGSQNAIYPWDKISTSFSLPIYVADGYIKRMVSANQNAFIFPGNTGGRGRIYITNGSQADLYYKIPDFIFGEQDPYYEWGDAVFHRNELLFSFFPNKNSGGGTIQNFGYVWALNLNTKAFRAISKGPVTATFINNATVLIAAVNPSTSGFSYIAGWDDSSTSPSITYSGTTAGVGTASLLTDKIPIGTFLQKKTFSQVEFKLRSPLQSGESLTMTPFIDDTIATNLTFSPTITTGSISGVAPVTFQGNQWLQLIVGLTGNSASSGVRLHEIRIR